MRAAAFLVGALVAPAAAAARPSVAVLWLPAAERSASGSGGEAWAEPDPALVESVRRGIASSPSVVPIADEDAARALATGGPASQVAARVAEARRLFAAQRFADADAALAAAESTALAELPTAALGPPLGAVESLRLVCADLARDDDAAARAVRLLQMSGAPIAPELAATVARHPPPASPPGPPVRVESDPDGADVFVDLRPAGKTPLDLPAGRRADALVDVEHDGYRKVHRVAPGAGTLAVALARDDRLGPLVDRLRREFRDQGELPAAEVAALGRRVGAERVLVARLGRTHGPEAAPAVEARVLDVAAGKWAKPVITVTTVGDDGGGALAARLASYAGPQPQAAPTLPPDASVAKAAAGAPAATTSRPAVPGSGWKKWYTWLIGGALIAVVVGFVIANHVGDDQVTVQASH